FKIRWKLVVLDLVMFMIINFFMLILPRSGISPAGLVAQTFVGLACIFLCRLVGKIYQQIWRYGGIQCYIRLVVSDTIAFGIAVLAEHFLLTEHISFSRLLAISSMNLLAALILRMFYRYA